MKAHKFAVFTGVFAASLSVSSFALATSGLSHGTYLNVGLTKPTGGEHNSSNQPGIGVKSYGGGELVAFADLATRVRPDRNNVVRIPSTPHTGTNLGSFNFQQAAGHNVYYGEWTAANNSAASRTVYYSGPARTSATSVPTSGVATYQVRGINRYNGSNVMTGTLRADYGRRTLVGSMRNSALTVGINATIYPAQTTFGGTATAGGVRGTTKGHFYGARATGIAGVAQFSNRAYDTAFGGRR